MAKFELFQRLNTGGSMATDQEVRNSILVMMNINLYKWIRELSRDPNFFTCAALSERALNEQYDMELVTRFIVFRTLSPSDLKSVGDVGEFLTERAKELARDKSFDYKSEDVAFRETFALLARTLEDDAFRRFDKSKGRFVGGFSVSAFEAIAIGIGYNPKAASANHAALAEKVKSMWTTTEFIENSGSGVSASSRVPKIIPFGRELFANEYSYSRRCK